MKEIENIFQAIIILIVGVVLFTAIGMADFASQIGSLSILIIISPILFFNFKYSLGMSNIDLETGFHSEVFKSLFEAQGPKHD